jgi:putative FmdB family regulatory protein
MPLYIYTCRTCELELEELHPLGQAPERSIRCPLCGGYFERDVALVNLGKKSTVGASLADALATGSVHGVDCLCCPPRRRNKPTVAGHRRWQNDER